MAETQRPALKDAIALVARFVLVGAANTVIGLGVIAGLDLGLHVTPALANAAGYVVGNVLGFILNRGFVFRSGTHWRDTGPKYLAAIALAFLVNQGVLHLVGPALGPGALQHLAAQITAMGSYTLTTFALYKLWVFKEPSQTVP